MEWIVSYLLDKGIEVRRGFNPMHRQEAFNSFDYITINNVSEKLFDSTILLPSGTGTTDEEADYVINSLKEILGGK